MKEKDPVILELREKLKDVYIRLYRLKRDHPEKIDEIDYLNDIAKQIKHKIALYKTEKAEEFTKKGR